MCNSRTAVFFYFLHVSVFYPINMSSSATESASVSEAPYVTLEDREDNSSVDLDVLLDSDFQPFQEAPFPQDKARNIFGRKTVVMMRRKYREVLGGKE